MSIDTINLLGVIIGIKLIIIGTKLRVKHHIRNTRFVNPLMLGGNKKVTHT